MAEAEYAIFLNGTYGVGKSATLDHLGDLLAGAGTPFSLIDVDWFHRSWPTATDDPRNVVIEAENISAVWANYRRAGPRRLVIGGVMTRASDRDRYEKAVDLPVRSVRLTADVTEVERRLRSRYSDSQGGSLDWHLDRHADLTRKLVEADLDEVVIDTTGRSPTRIASLVAQHFAL